MNPAGLGGNEIVLYIGTEKLIALEGSLDGREPRILRYAVSEDREGFEKGFVKSLDNFMKFYQPLAEHWAIINNSMIPPYFIVRGELDRVEVFDQQLYKQIFNPKDS